MPTEITRAEARRLIDAGAQLVDVLPEREYADEHITGALSIPLRRIDGEGTSGLDRSRPVVVYCFDSA